MGDRRNFLDADNSRMERNLRFVKNDFEESMNQFFSPASVGGGNYNGSSSQPVPPREYKVVQPTPASFSYGNKRYYDTSQDQIYRNQNDFYNRDCIDNKRRRDGNYDFAGRNTHQMESNEKLNPGLYNPNNMGPGCANDVMGSRISYNQTNNGGSSSNDNCLFKRRSEIPNESSDSREHSYRSEMSYSTNCNSNDGYGFRNYNNPDGGIKMPGYNDGSRYLQNQPIRNNEYKFQNYNNSDDYNNQPGGGNQRNTISNINKGYRFSNYNNSDSDSKNSRYNEESEYGHHQLNMKSNNDEYVFQNYKNTASYDLGSEYQNISSDKFSGCEDKSSDNGLFIRRSQISNTNISPGPSDFSMINQLQNVDQIKPKAIITPSENKHLSEFGIAAIDLTDFGKTMDILKSQEEAALLERPKTPDEYFDFMSAISGDDGILDDPSWSFKERQIMNFRRSLALMDQLKAKDPLTLTLREKQLMRIHSQQIQKYEDYWNPKYRVKDDWKDSDWPPKDKQMEYYYRRSLKYIQRINEKDPSSLTDQHKKNVLGSIVRIRIYEQKLNVSNEAIKFAIKSLSRKFNEDLERSVDINLKNPENPNLLASNEIDSSRYKQALEVIRKLTTKDSLFITAVDRHQILLAIKYMKKYESAKNITTSSKVTNALQHLSTKLKVDLISMALDYVPPKDMEIISMTHKDPDHQEPDAEVISKQNESTANIVDKYKLSKYKQSARRIRKYNEKHPSTLRPKDKHFILTAIRSLQQCRSALNVCDNKVDADIAELSAKFNENLSTKADEYISSDPILIENLVDDLAGEEAEKRSPEFYYKRSLEFIKCLNEKDSLRINEFDKNFLLMSINRLNDYESSANISNSDIHAIIDELCRKYNEDFRILANEYEKPYGTKFPSALAKDTGEEENENLKQCTSSENSGGEFQVQGPLIAGLEIYNSDTDDTSDEREHNSQGAKPEEVVERPKTPDAYFDFLNAISSMDDNTNNESYNFSGEDGFSDDPSCSNESIKGGSLNEKQLIGYKRSLAFIRQQNAKDPNTLTPRDKHLMRKHNHHIQKYEECVKANKPMTSSKKNFDKKSEFYYKRSMKYLRKINEKDPSALTDKDQKNVQSSVIRIRWYERNRYVTNEEIKLTIKDLSRKFKRDFEQDFQEHLKSSENLKPAVSNESINDDYNDEKSYKQAMDLIKKLSTKSTMLLTTNDKHEMLMAIKYIKGFEAAKNISTPVKTSNSIQQLSIKLKKDIIAIALNYIPSQGIDPLSITDGKPQKALQKIDPKSTIEMTNKPKNKTQLYIFNQAAKQIKRINQMPITALRPKDKHFILTSIRTVKRGRSTLNFSDDNVDVAIAELSSKFKEDLSKTADEYNVSDPNLRQYGEDDEEENGRHLNYYKRSLEFIKGVNQKNPSTVSRFDKTFLIMAINRINLYESMVNIKDPDIAVVIEELSEKHKENFRARAEEFDQPYGMKFPGALTDYVSDQQNQKLSQSKAHDDIDEPGSEVSGGQKSRNSKKSVNQKRYGNYRRTLKFLRELSNTDPSTYTPRDLSLAHSAIFRAKKFMQIENITNTDVLDELVNKLSIKFKHDFNNTENVRNNQYNPAKIASDKFDDTLIEEDNQNSLDESESMDQNAGEINKSTLAAGEKYDEDNELKSFDQDDINELTEDTMSATEHCALTGKVRRTYKSFLRFIRKLRTKDQSALTFNDLFHLRKVVSSINKYKTLSNAIDSETRKAIEELSIKFNDDFVTPLEGRKWPDDFIGTSN